MRPDIAFDSNRKLKNDIETIDLESNNLYVYRWGTKNVPEADIKIEDVHFFGNSKVMDSATKFIEWETENFYNQIDRQILHFNYVKQNDINIITEIKKDFIVYRYFMNEVKLSLDEIIYRKNNNVII